MFPVKRARSRWFRNGVVKGAVAPFASIAQARYAATPTAGLNTPRNAPHSIGNAKKTLHSKTLVLIITSLSPSIYIRQW